MKKLGVGLSVVLGTGLALSAAGTALSIVFGEPSVVCPDGDVSASYTISTTAADAATVTETLTDSNSATVTQKAYTIPAGNVSGGWIFAGRTKTYDGLFQANGLSNGTYSLQVCATQSGAGGNPDKTVCNSVTIIVACADPNPCASVGPFGEVVGNNRIRVDSAAQILFRGNFGPSALIEITDTEGFYRSATVVRAGDSCNYHANWKFTNDSGADIYGNNGDGVYTVTVTGNNQTPLEFSVTLRD
jgi:hypothetical protein